MDGWLTAFQTSTPTPWSREQCKRFLFKRNVLNIGQIFLQCQLTFLNYLTSVLLPTSSGFGPLFSSQPFNCFLSSPTGFCSESAQLCPPKPVTGIDRPKCNFPEQEGGENFNAISSNCIVGISSQSCHFSLKKRGVAKSRGQHLCWYKKVKHPWSQWNWLHVAENYGKSSAYPFGASRTHSCSGYKTE